MSDLTAAAKPAPVLATAITRDHLLPARRPLDKRHAELDGALRDNATARTDAEAEQAAVEAERDPRPRDPQFWLRRERPEGVGTVGAPLWRLVEKTEPDAPVARSRRPWTPPACCRPGSHRTAPTSPGATAAMSSGPPRRPRPAPRRRRGRPRGHYRPSCGPPMTRVRSPGSWPGCSRRSATATTSPPQGRRSARTAGGVTANSPGGQRRGRRARACWARRHGRPTGPAASRLFTAGWRAGAERERLSAELTGIDELLGALDAAAERLPGDSEVVSAVLRLRDAVQAAEEAAEEAGVADQAERTARSSADTAAAEVARHCAEHDLPRAPEEVEGVRNALGEYQSAVSGLVAAMSLVPPLRAAAGQAAEVVGQCREAYERAEQDADGDGEEALSLRAKADAARAALTKEAQEIIEEVGRLGRRIRDAEESLKAAGQGPGRPVRP